VSHMATTQKEFAQTLPEIPESCSHNKTHTSCTPVSPVLCKLD
jgi:hypothetical protein